MKITFEQLLSFRPCYPYRNREHLLSITGGREEIEVSEISSLRIPVSDKVWVLLKILGTCEDSAKKQRLFACDCAEYALLQERDSGIELDPMLWESIKVSRLFANGQETMAELRKANLDAFVAVDGAPDAVSYAPAYASYAAAYTAASYSSFAAGHGEWQVKKLLEYIGS